MAPGADTDQKRGENCVLLDTDFDSAKEADAFLEIEEHMSCPAVWEPGHPLAVSHSAVASTRSRA